MTKFTSICSNESEKKVKTVFERIVYKDATTDRFNELAPKDFTDVMFLGHDTSYGDVFKIWNKDPENFIIVFGKKGNENYETVLK